MNAYQKEALVGLIVIIAIGLFIGGGLWLRGKKVGKPDVNVVFADIGNLKEGAPVRISGAAVGRVVDIRFDSVGKVMVGLKVSRAVQPTVNAKAAIVGIGMLGDDVIDFDPGQGAPLPPGATIEGTMAPGIMGKGAELVDKASEAMTSINAMLDRQLIVDLRRTLTNMSKLMDHLADPKNGPTAQVAPTMLSLQATSARLDSTLKGFDPKAMQTRIDTTLRSATRLSDRLAATSAHVDSLMTRMERGNGTISKLLNDSTLYHDFHEIAVSLKKLVDEIAKNPGKIGITVRIP